MINSNSDNSIIFYNYKTILSCSVGASLNESGQVVYEWSEEGPVYGPNGELELDPDNLQCYYTRSVFSTCKNNCPGGEFNSRN